MIKEMQRVAKNLKMQLDFRFPEHNEKQDLSQLDAREDNILSIAIVLESALSLDVVNEVFGYLAGHSCQILEIEHRSDNRMETNSDLTKIDIRISAPSHVA